MVISRLLVLVVLVPACVGPVRAQSLGDKSPASSQPQSTRPVISADSNADFAALPHKDADNPNGAGLERPTYFAEPLKTGKEDASCFFIRSYRVMRNDPKSDATRFAGYSECQPASRFQPKTAVEVLKTDPR